VHGPITLGAIGVPVFWICLGCYELWWYGWPRVGATGSDFQVGSFVASGARGGAPEDDRVPVGLGRALGRGSNRWGLLRKTDLWPQVGWKVVGNCDIDFYNFHDRKV
jgi:hypothetical protein